MNHESSKSEVTVDPQVELRRIERLLRTDPAQAEAQAARFLATVPGHQMALLFQGIASRLAGNLDAAIDILTMLSASSPDAPLVHLQLGLALRGSGRNEDAVQSMRRAIRVKPDFSDAWLALADLFTALGDRESADEAFSAYVRYSVNDPHLREPAAALAEGRVTEAETLLRKHIERHPVDIVALCLLADVVERNDRTAEAEALLERCIELAPGYQRARHNYAVVLLRRNRAFESLQESGRLLADEPDNPDLRKLRAATLARLREYDDAIEICERLVDEDPGQVTVWTSLGHLLKSVGRRADSVKAYRKAIAQAPHFGEPYWGLASFKTLKFTGPELESMRTQLARADLGDEDRIHFNFAIGKALEDRAEFAASFRHYSDGNRLCRKYRQYNAAELSDHVRRCIALFTPGFIADRVSCGAGTPDPIFILGLPRTGSTLVEQILSSHSSVEGTMELPDIAALAMSLGEGKPAPHDTGYPEVLANLEEDALRELGDTYIEQTRVQRKLGTPFFIDKMPNNFIHLGLIHLILPNARIVDVRRHPLACGLSLFKEHFARAQNFSYDLEDIGRYYRDYVEFMAHFDTVLPGRVHRIIYESLVTDTEAEVRRLLQYCELPYEESCLHFYKNDRDVSTASSEQVRSPIFQKGIDHWRHYESWLDPLKDALGSLVEAYPGLPALTDMDGRSVNED